MATTITVQEAVTTGLEATYEAAALTMEYAHPGVPHFIHVKNGATDCTLTIDSQVNCNQGVDHDTGGLCSANEERIYAPISAARYKDSSGNVQLSFDDVTNVTIAVIKMALHG
jgi:hypothetical protein